jgi:heptosyltransferase-3
VIDALALKNISVVLSGSQSDLQDNEDIISLCKSKPTLVKDFSLKDTAALYQLANLVVTIDSMSTHLSSAVGTPVISIFGPTSDKNWGPWMVKHKIIALGELDDPSFSCRPCYKEGCEGSRVSDCLNQVNYKSIIDNICDLLNKK